MSGVFLGLMSLAGAQACAAVDLSMPRAACSEAFLADDAAREANTLSSLLVAIEGEPVIAALARQPGRKGNCSYQASPERRPLEPADYQAVVDFSRPRAKQQDVFFCPGIYAVKVYDGYCGSSASPTLVGAATMVSDTLATSSTAFLPASGQVCLKHGDQYLDVHAVRTSGSGNLGLVGYSLMRSGPAGIGFGVVGPDLWTGHVRTVGVYPFGETACYDGSTHGQNSTQSWFLSFAQHTAYPLNLMLLGGPVDITIPNTPIYQQSNGRAFGYQTVDTGTTRQVFVHYARNTTANQSTVGGWLGTTAPASPITITYPADGATWSGLFGPQSVTIAQTKYPATALSVAVDGTVYPYTLKSMWPLASGWHTVSIYLTASPQFRHTIRIYQP